MKKLFLLLVVVNLVIWLWGERDRLTGVAERPEPDVGVIRFLDDAELAVRREQSRRDVGSGDAAIADIPLQRPATVPEPAGAPPAEAPVASADAAIPSAPLPADQADEPVSPLAQHGSGATEVPVTSSVPPPFEELVPASTPIAAAAVAADASAGPGVPEVAAPGPSETPAQPDVPAAEQAVSVAAPAPAPAAADADSRPPVELAREPVEEPATAEPSEPATPMATEEPAAAVEATGEPAASAAEEPVAIPKDAPAPTASAVPEEPREPPPSPAARDVTETPVQAAPEPVYVCESLGPFADRSAALRAQETMVAPFRDATVREERVTRAVRHWVLAPVQPSREATSEYLTRLGQAGVKDAWRIPNGPLAGRLAVGVFQSLANARKHADMLAAKGVEAEVHAPKDLDPNRTYWVDYERPADASPPPLPASRTPPAQKIVTRACGRVAGP